MASFTAGTTFVDGVANDVTAAKLGALVTNATPTSGLIQDRTAETVVATNDTLLIGDASDSNTLKRMTVANVMKAELTGTINTSAGTIQTLTSSTATITTGTVATLNSTTGTITNLNSTTGTVATLNSTTGTIATLVATGTITGSTNIMNVGSGQIYKDSSGNVGIGTTSPQTKLHIATGGAIQFDRPDGTNQFRLGYTANDTALKLNFNAGSALAVVDSSGNVGIGLASPEAKIHVQGAGTTSGSYTNGDADGQALYLQDTGASQGNGGQILFGASSGIFAGIKGFLDNGTGPAGNLILQTRTTSGNVLERLRVDYKGDVGIGVTAPVNKLEVVGSFGRGAPVTKTADFTLAATENWIIVNKATTSCTATLPAASSWTGREFTIKTLQALTVVSASANVVPINGTTAGTAILPAASGSWATLVSNGTSWVTMAS